MNGMNEMNEMDEMNEVHCEDRYIQALEEVDGFEGVYPRGHHKVWSKVYNSFKAYPRVWPADPHHCHVGYLRRVIRVVVDPYEAVA